MASVCVLSALIEIAFSHISDPPEHFVEVLVAVRANHLKLMLDLLEPGGVGVLICDFVSSESLAELLTETDIMPLIKEAIENRNHFHGVAPSLVANVFNQPPIAGMATNIRATQSWRWHTADKVYACYGMVFEKV